MLQERNQNQKTTFPGETSRVSGWGKPLLKAKSIPNDDTKILKPNTVVVTISKQQNSTIQKPQHGAPSSNYEEEKISYNSEQSQSDKLAYETGIKLNKATMFNQKDIYKSVPIAQKSDAVLKEEIGKKLVCSLTRQNIFDPLLPTLGYVIYLDKDTFGRLRPLCSFEMLSYDGYKHAYEEKNAVNKSAYAYWLPLYIDQAHFERSRHYILNSIAMMFSRSKDEKNNQFEPKMILKVLPPILVKTVMMFLERKDQESCTAIEGYCQYYQLLVKLIEEFPELKGILDREVEDFCLREENRHKKQLGDLGEFVIKLALSSKGLNDPEINNLLLRERLARQVSWALKTDKKLQQYQDCEDLIERFLVATKFSNQLFLIQLEAAKLLLDDSVKAELEGRHGILEGGKMRLFKERLEWIKKNITSDWKIYVEGIGQTAYICSDQAMKAYIQKAFHIAKNKGYLS